MNLDDMTKRFLLGEDRKPENVLTYLQALKETINALNPKTQTDYRRLEIAKQHITEIRKLARRLQERVSLLEEQVKIMEEGKK